MAGFAFFAGFFAAGLALGFAFAGFVFFAAGFAFLAGFAAFFAGFVFLAGFGSVFFAGSAFFTGFAGLAFFAGFVFLAGVFGFLGALRTTVPPLIAATISRSFKSFADLPYFLLATSLAMSPRVRFFWRTIASTMLWIVAFWTSPSIRDSSSMVFSFYPTIGHCA